MPCTLRPAAPTDVPVIVQLIRELAAYEKLLDQVVATEELIALALFGSNPKAQVIIAEVGTVIAGFALYFPTFSTFLARPGLYLEDLYVRPQYRGMGIGKAVLSELAQIARADGCLRLEWSVLNWNQSAIDFYRRLGAKPQDDWTVYRLSGTALTEMAALARPKQG